MTNILDRRTVLGGFLALLAGDGSLKAYQGQSFIMSPAKATKETRPYGEVVRYQDGPLGAMKRLLVSQTTLKPGAEPHPPHVHIEPEILIVAKGNGEISSLGRVMQVGPGGFLYAAPNEIHGVKNTGIQPMTYYVFRWLPL